MKINPLRFGLGLALAVYRQITVIFEKILLKSLRRCGLEKRSALSELKRKLEVRMSAHPERGHSSPVGCLVIPPVNQDELKTRPRCLQAANKGLVAGRSVVIDRGHVLTLPKCHDTAGCGEKAG